jgi:hypothetical protein
MPSCRWRKRGLTVEDIRSALGNGDDIESRPDDQRYPSRLVLGTCRSGSPSVAVRDTIDDDEIVPTAYQPDPALWEPDFSSPGNTA